MASTRTALKIYCLVLGSAVSFSAFVWLAFQIYALSLTESGQTDLIVGRYLDISFGLLGVSSSLALLYGAVVESKTWIGAWTLGSATAVVGFWAWFFYRRYGVRHPESFVEARSLGFALTVWYAILLVPVLVYANHLRSNPPSCVGTLLRGLISAETCKHYFCVDDEEEERNEECGGGGGGGGKTLVFVNNSGKSAKLYKSRNPCRIVTADDCDVTVIKDEDLYNPV